MKCGMNMINGNLCDTKFLLENITNIFLLGIYEWYHMVGSSGISLYISGRSNKACVASDKDYTVYFRSRNKAVDIWGNILSHPVGRNVTCR